MVYISSVGFEVLLGHLKIMLVFLSSVCSPTEQVIQERIVAYEYQQIGKYIPKEENGK